MRCRNCGDNVGSASICPNCNTSLFEAKSDSKAGVAKNGRGIEVNTAINPVTAYISMFKKYFQFSGRSGRKEFWFTQLMDLIIRIIFVFIYTKIDIADFDDRFDVLLFVLLFALYNVSTFIPMLALGVRRLHDTSKGAGRMFMGLIPFIGPLILFIFYCQEGDYGMNYYGPKADGLK